jgi:hypothetical protein
VFVDVLEDAAMKMTFPAVKGIHTVRSLESTQVFVRRCNFKRRDFLARWLLLQRVMCSTRRHELPDKYVEEIVVRNPIERNERSPVTAWR